MAILAAITIILSVFILFTGSLEKILLGDQENRFEYGWWIGDVPIKHDKLNYRVWYYQDRNSCWVEVFCYDIIMKDFKLSEASKHG